MFFMNSNFFFYKKNIRTINIIMDSNGFYFNIFFLCKPLPNPFSIKYSFLVSNFQFVGCSNQDFFIFDKNFFFKFYLPLGNNVLNF